MARAKIVFCNLRAEMARTDITIAAIANALGISRETAGKKLAKKAPIQLDEAFTIQSKFFPERDICYLFSEVTETSKFTKTV